MRPIFAAGTAILLIMLFAGTAVHESARIEADTYADLVSGYIIPPVTYAGQKYVIQADGSVVHQQTNEDVPAPTARKILRIAYFSIHQRIDPIFALPGVNVANLQSLREVLKSQVETFSTTYPEEYRTLIREYTHPLTLLSKMATAEQRRRELVAHPSDIHVAAYYRATVVAIEAYGTYIDALRDILKTLAAENEHQPIYFTGGSTAPDRFQQVLSFYTQESRRRRTQLDTRWACYRGTQERCEKPALPAPGLGPHTTRTDAPAMDQDIQEIAHTIDRFRQSQPSIVPNQPLAHMTTANSTCAPHVPTAQYRVFWQETPGSIDAFRLEFVNDLYFADLSKDAFLQNAYYVKAKAAGLPYFYQPMTNQYMCPEFVHDFSEAATLAWLTDTFTMHSNLPTALADVKATVENAAALPVSTRHRIAQTLYKFLTTNDERVLAQKYGADMILELTDMYTTATLQTGYYTHVLANAFHDNRSVYTIRQYDADRIDSFFLFFFRSYFKMFLFAANRSVIQNDLSLIAEPDEASLSIRPFASYRSSLSHQYTAEQLLTLLHQNEEIAEELEWADPIDAQPAN